MSCQSLYIVFSASSLALNACALSHHFIFRRVWPKTRRAFARRAATRRGKAGPGLPGFALPSAMKRKPARAKKAVKKQRPAKSAGRKRSAASGSKPALRDALEMAARMKPGFLPNHNTKKKGHAVLVQNRLLWQQLLKIHSGLSFKKKDIDSCVEQVGATLNGEKGGWKVTLEPLALADWCTTVSNRLRSQARFIAQSMVKHPNAGWLKDLLNPVEPSPGGLNNQF